MSYRLADINDEFHRLTAENYKQPALTQQNKKKIMIMNKVIQILDP